MSTTFSKLIIFSLGFSSSLFASKFPSSTSEQSNVPHVVKGCPDGDFKEKYADLNVSLKDIVDGYKPEKSTEFILEATKRRYLAGNTILKNRLSDKLCTQFLPKDNEKGAKADLGSFASVIVHECGHMYNHFLNGTNYGSSTYYINENYKLTCEGADTDGKNQAPKRGIIYKDSFHKDAPGYEDIYSDLYLKTLGNQGFPLLLEEYAQYVNNVAAHYSLHDNIPNAWNIRAGAMNFAWYVQRYLYKTRKENPQGYENIAGNACWRKAILLNWGRMWHFVDAAKNVTNIGSAYKKLQPALEKPELLNEINLLRKKHGCVN